MLFFGDLSDVKGDKNERKLAVLEYSRIAYLTRVLAAIFVRVLDPEEMATFKLFNKCLLAE